MHVQTLKPDSNKFHLRTYMKVFLVHIYSFLRYTCIYIYICADNTLSKTPIGVFVFSWLKNPNHQSKQETGWFKADQ